MGQELFNPQLYKVLHQGSLFPSPPRGLGIDKGMNAVQRCSAKLMFWINDLEASQTRCASLDARRSFEGLQ